MKKPAKKKTADRTALVPAAAHPDEMKFRAQDALHTLRRAHEIQNDPALMRHIQVHARGEREHLNKIIRKKVK